MVPGWSWLFVLIHPDADGVCAQNALFLADEGEAEGEAPLLPEQHWHQELLTQGSCGSF